MNKALLSALVVMAALAAGPAMAQAPNPAAGGAVAEPPATAAAPPAAGGIQSQNIFEVKPEASADPNYLNQSNGERAKVQPGNNAPMWRQVGQGVTGYSSLPKSQAPEAGNLIQPFVQYPGSTHTNAGEAWRQVRNDWIIPYGAALLFVVLLAIAIFYFTHGTDPAARRGDRPQDRALHAVRARRPLVQRDRLRARWPSRAW